MTRLALFLPFLVFAFALTSCSCVRVAFREPAAAPVQTQERTGRQALLPELTLSAPTPEPDIAPAPEPVVKAVLRDVHFDPDSYDIRPVDQEILKKNYQWFATHPGKVIIEGHCDERGTVKYNMFLGHKRAHSVKRFLAALGVDPKRMQTISYGKGRPVDRGHNKEAWAKNGRVHFVPLDQQ